MSRNISIDDIFKSFSDDFEATFQDDDWSRLEKYFTDDATYKNVNDPDSEYKGHDAILSYLKADVTHFDRLFDARNLAALSPPEVNGNRLSRRWRTTFSLKGSPDLIVEGEARYLFDGELIKAIEEEVTPESLRNLAKWMQDYGDRLEP
jgi:hypothetical protein